MISPGSKNRGSRGRKKTSARSFLPRKIASGNDRPRGKDLEGWNLCHSFPSDNFSVPPRMQLRTTFFNSTFLLGIPPSFLFAKYEFLSLERKNYDEPPFFTSIFGREEEKLLGDVILCAKNENRRILSRLVNCW